MTPVNRKEQEQESARGSYRGKHWDLYSPAGFRHPDFERQIS